MRQYRTAASVGTTTIVTTPTATCAPLLIPPPESLSPPAPSGIAGATLDAADDCTDDSLNVIVDSSVLVVGGLLVAVGLSATADLLLVLADFTPVGVIVVVTAAAVLLEIALVNVV